MENTMKSNVINPWRWQEQFGYQQGHHVIGAQSTLWISGQTSVDGDGKPVSVGDMRGQIHLVIENIEAVLAAADMTPANIVRIKFLTTDMDLFVKRAYELKRLNDTGSRHTSTVAEVSRLAYPEFLIEMEATAVA
jgi:enamine deaminase RidA (YjgF/YER057c/UK114 family)